MKILKPFIYIIYPLLDFKGAQISEMTSFELMYVISYI